MTQSAQPHASAPNSGDHTSRMSPIAALDEGSLALSSADDTATPHQGLSEWLGVRIGPIGLLLPATAGRELLDPPLTACLPHTPPWLTGLANVRGALVPVVDTARALDVEHSVDARHYLLIFNHGDEALGLIVDGLPRLHSFEVRERLSGLPPHPALLNGHLTSAYDRDGLLWFEIDLNGFFDTLAQILAQA